MLYALVSDIDSRVFLMEDAFWAVRSPDGVWAEKGFPSATELMEEWSPLPDSEANKLLREARKALSS